jgi:hypothetical protein
MIAMATMATPSVNNFGRSRWSALSMTACFNSFSD